MPGFFDSQRQDLLFCAVGIGEAAAHWLDLGKTDPCQTLQHIGVSFQAVAVQSERPADPVTNKLAGRLPLPLRLHAKAGGLYLFLLDTQICRELHGSTYIVVELFFHCANVVAGTAADGAEGEAIRCPVDAGFASDGNGVMEGFARLNHLDVTTGHQQQRDKRHAEILQILHGSANEPGLTLILQKTAPDASTA